MMLILANSPLTPVRSGLHGSYSVLFLTLSQTVSLALSSPVKSSSCGSPVQFVDSPSSRRVPHWPPRLLITRFELRADRSEGRGSCHVANISSGCELGARLASRLEASERTL